MSVTQTKVSGAVVTGVLCLLLGGAVGAAAMGALGGYFAQNKQTGGPPGGSSSLQIQRDHLRRGLDLQRHASLLLDASQVTA